VLVPQVSSEEEQSDVMLEAERADEILQYLSKYHYASRGHTLFTLLWETGMRIGAARSLDLRDVNIEDRFLDVTYRPEKGTTLKNGQGGERLVAISPDLADLVHDYTNDIRPDMTDDYGQSPLLPGNQGRLSRSTIRRIVYTITAPCYLDQECPDCKDDAYAKCGEAVSLHAIRRGSHPQNADRPLSCVMGGQSAERPPVACIARPLL
jgi:site-specific recombinase XerD